MAKIAIVQMTASDQTNDNLDKVLRFIQAAAEVKADLIAFPENCLFIGLPGWFRSNPDPVPQSVIEKIIQEAQDQGISILLGSICERDPDHPGKYFNTAFLIDEKGTLLGRYRKIHLFDISLPDVQFFESKIFSPGDRITVLRHRIGQLGLSICYDIRFPGLYQRLRQAGAEIVFVPSAFTVPTGKDHWLPLLRARAIENQVYIVAPAQYGRHHDARTSYGKSAMIDPWGTVLAIAPDQETMIFGEVNLEYLTDVRKRMPVQAHRVPGIDLVVNSRSIGHNEG